jgi:hypothetical protein
MPTLIKQGENVDWSKYYDPRKYGQGQTPPRGRIPLIVQGQQLAYPEHTIMAPLTPQVSAPTPGYGAAATAGAAAARAAAQAPTPAPAPVGTTPVATPIAEEAEEATPALYSPEYYSALRESVLGEATSPAEQERARALRSEMAGKGILSGSAFDVAQTQRLGEFETEAEKTVREAKLKGAEYEAGSPDTQIAALQPLIESGSATPEIKAMYNRLMRKKLGLPETTTAAVPGQQGAPTGGIDFTLPYTKAGGAAKQAEISTQKATLAPQLIQAKSDYSPVYQVVSRLIGGSHIHQQSNPAKDFTAFTSLAARLDAQESDPNVAPSAADVDLLSRYTKAFKELADTSPSGANIQSDNAVWEQLKRKYNLPGASVVASLPAASPTPLPTDLSLPYQNLVTTPGSSFYNPIAAMLRQTGGA